VAAARSEKELESTLDEVRDRYGALPDSVLNLAEYGRIRVLADRLGVDTIDREGRLVVIKFRAQAKVDPVRLINVVHDHPDVTLVPPGSLKLDLEAATRAAGNLKVSGYQDRRSATDGKSGAGSRRPSGLRTPGSPETSWWTARATAGQVTAGFTKEEILRKPEANPRAEGGMFARLEELLRALG
jgi:transcription-repair coupling factor (superfamily II helicase)